MFLLFQKNRHYGSAYHRIYIPICFYYFRGLPFHHPSAGTFTFQYVSIISQVFLSRYHLNDTIYIPICFYYFRYLLLPSCSPCTIYIPICFYYFRKQDVRELTEEVNLHSNMFLLFRLDDSYERNYYRNLHSNMFLLFQKNMSIRQVSLMTFTFQYVSIISFWGCGQAFALVVFTFQYVSIISKL